MLEWHRIIVRIDEGSLNGRYLSPEEQASEYIRRRDLIHETLIGLVAYPISDGGSESFLVYNDDFPEFLRRAFSNGYQSFLIVDGIETASFTDYQNLLDQVNSAERPRTQWVPDQVIETSSRSEMRARAGYRNPGISSSAAPAQETIEMEMSELTGEMPKGDPLLSSLQKDLVTELSTKSKLISSNAVEKFYNYLRRMSEGYSTSFDDALDQAISKYHKAFADLLSGTFQFRMAGFMRENLVLRRIDSQSKAFFDGLGKLIETDKSLSEIYVEFLKSIFEKIIPSTDVKEVNKLAKDFVKAQAELDALRMGSVDLKETWQKQLKVKVENFFDRLISMDWVVGIEFVGDTFVVKTKDLLMDVEVGEGPHGIFNLGPFEIGLRMERYLEGMLDLEKKMGKDFKDRIQKIDYFPSSPWRIVPSGWRDSEIPPHPHISSNGTGPCFGNLKEGIAKLLALMDFENLYPILWTYLSSYNPDSCFIKIDRYIRHRFGCRVEERRVR